MVESDEADVTEKDAQPIENQSTEGENLQNCQPQWIDTKEQ